MKAKIEAIKGLVKKINRKKSDLKRYSTNIFRCMDAMIYGQNELYEKEYELFESEYLYT